MTFIFPKRRAGARCAVRVTASGPTSRHRLREGWPPSSGKANDQKPANRVTKKHRPVGSIRRWVSGVSHKG
jgi:hypothetical protein